MMEIKKAFVNKILDIQIYGELDANSSLSLDEVIKDAIHQKHTKITINCEGLNYISSAGMGVFISHLDELKSQGGRFVLYNMSQGIFSVFEILGLHQEIDIVKKHKHAQKLLNEG